EVALALQPLADELGVEPRLVAEDLGIRAEGDDGAGAAEVADALQLRARLSALEGLPPLGAVAPDDRGQGFREAVPRRRADAVQTAGVDVVPLLELAARVERREDDLERRLLVLRDVVDGNAAAVVDDGDRPAVVLEPHLDAVGVAVDDLVDAVVDYLPEKVVVAARIGAADVHRRPLADRVEPLEDLDVLGGVSRHLPLARHQFIPSGVKLVTLTGGGTILSVVRRASGRPLPPRACGGWSFGPISIRLPAAVSTTIGRSSAPRATPTPMTRSPSATLM